jgi:hypothetical protein
MDKDNDEPKLPLIFTHVYDTVEINTTVPWQDMDPTSQALAKKVVDYYRMQASIKVDAHVQIRSLNVDFYTPDDGMLYSVIVAVEEVDKDNPNIEDFIGEGDEYGE